MKKELYFIRHGQTDRNLNRIMNPGDVDSELNNTGIEQAIKAGEDMKNDGIKIDLIISSPLIRAVNTAKIIAEKIGYKSEIFLEEDLKEKYAGVFKDYPQDQIKKEFGVRRLEDIFIKYPDKNFEGVEKFEDFRIRIEKITEKIRNNPEYRDKEILIVAHGGVSRVLANRTEKVENCELIKV